MDMAVNLCVSIEDIALNIIARECEHFIGANEMSTW